MRGVGHEPSLAGEGEVEAVQHVVEGVGELLQLVVRPVEADPLVEMFLRGAPCGAGDLVERDQDPPSDRPSQDAGHDGGDTETDQGPQEQLMKVVRSLRRRTESAASAKACLHLATWAPVSVPLRLRYRAGPHERLIHWWVGDRSRAEAVVDERVGSGDERSAGDQEQPRAGQRNSGPHAAPAEDLAPKFA